MVTEIVFETIDEPAFRDEGEAFVPRARSPLNVLGVVPERIHECVPDRLGGPLTLRKENSIVVRGEADEVDLVFPVPPSTKLRVGSELTRFTRGVKPRGTLAALPVEGHSLDNDYRDNGLSRSVVESSFRGQ